MDTPFFYPAETDESVAFHKSQAMGGQLTEIEDIAPIVRFLLTEGWWSATPAPSHLRRSCSTTASGPTAARCR